MDDAESTPGFGSVADDPALEAGPSLERIESVFDVYETRVEDDRLVYYGDPLAPPEPLVRDLWPVFREQGYDLEFRTRHGEYVLIAEPTTVGVDGIPWTNVVLLVATIASALFGGAFWYQIDPFSDPTAIWRAWPFALAVLGVLGVHEMGHYLASRYHEVDASLPYFIPMPSLIGTMGAVIKMKGQMPNRRALFDIGVAGPLAGLAATVAVAVLGLHLPPVTVPESLAQDPDAIRVQLGYPPLLELLAGAFDQPLYRDDPTASVNPVVVGAWVGMFVTFLNMIPVGQLDGGHVLRAMVGDLQETIAALVPAVLLGFAAYLYTAGGYGFHGVFVWGLWGVITVFLAAAGPARPIHDEPLGSGRRLLGAVAFGLAALCFMPVPIEVVQ